MGNYNCTIFDTCRYIKCENVQLIVLRCQIEHKSNIQLKMMIIIWLLWMEVFIIIGGAFICIITKCGKYWFFFFFFNYMNLKFSTNLVIVGSTLFPRSIRIRNATNQMFQFACTNYIHSLVTVQNDYSFVFIIWPTTGA